MFDTMNVLHLNLELVRIQFHLLSLLVDQSKSDNPNWRLLHIVQDLMLMVLWVLLLILEVDTWFDHN